MVDDRALTVSKNARKSCDRHIGERTKRNKTANRPASSYRLHRLGWTDEEIGKAIGVSHDVALNISRQFPDLEKDVKKLLADGIEVPA